MSLPFASAIRKNLLHLRNELDAFIKAQVILGSRGNLILRRYCVEAHII